VIDPAALQMVLCVLTGWLDRRERETAAYGASARAPSWSTRDANTEADRPFHM